MITSVARRNVRRAQREDQSIFESAALMAHQVKMLAQRVSALEEENAHQSARIKQLEQNQEKLPIAVFKAFDRYVGQVSELEHRLKLLEGEQ